jgi:ferritin-like metal-binding protein YciE
MAKSLTPDRDAVIARYLNEAYGKEKQLETALQAQIKIVSRPQLKQGLKDHLAVTKAQARGLKKRIKELGGTASESADLPGPGVITEAAAGVTSVANKAIAAAKGPVQALRGTSDADNDLRNVRDCYWNEAEEIAHYTLIESIADQLGDQETVQLARAYRRDEVKMQKLLERQIPALTKAVAQAEIPAAQRRKPQASRSRSRSSSRPASSGSSSRSPSSSAAPKRASSRRTKAAAS